MIKLRNVSKMAVELRSAMGPVVGLKSMYGIDSQVQGWRRRTCPLSALVQLSFVL